MNVMVTGAGGFVGQHAIWRLHRAGHRVYVLKGRGEGGIDLRLAPPPTTEPFDVIVHLAGDSNLADSREMPRRCIENNVGSLLTMLDYARNRGCRFIHLSTDEALEPTNPYGASKAAQEAIIQAYRATYGLSIVVVRADLVVGVGQLADKFVPTVMRRLSAGEPVDIYTSHGVVGKRSWQGVRNLADALAFLVHETPWRFHACHVGGLALGNDELARYVADLMARPLELRLVERPEVRAADRSDATPRLSQFGWERPYSLRQELEQMVGAPVSA